MTSLTHTGFRGNAGQAIDRRFSLFNDSACQDLDQAIEKWLDETLSDPNKFERVRITSAGKEFIQMHDLKFLNDAECHLRWLMENLGHHIAVYYFEEFNKFLENHRIYELLKEKSYHQPYILNIRDFSNFEASQAEIDREFKDICRWVSVYELMRNPLLTLRDKKGSSRPHIADEVAKYMMEVALKSFEASVKTQAPGSGFLINRLKERFGRAIQKKLHESGLDPENNPGINGEESQMDRCLRELRSAISTALNQKDIQGIKQLVGKEIWARSKEALEESLPYLDMLFFYQLEKHQKRYDQVIDSLHREHTQQVLDRNETIRQLIIRKNDRFFTKALEMLETYSFLLKCGETGIPNSFLN